MYFSITTTCRFQRSLSCRKASRKASLLSTVGRLLLLVLVGVLCCSSNHPVEAWNSNVGRTCRLVVRQPTALLQHAPSVRRPSVAIKTNPHPQRTRFPFLGLQRFRSRFEDSFRDSRRIFFFSVMGVLLGALTLLPGSALASSIPSTAGAVTATMDPVSAMATTTATGAAISSSLPPIVAMDSATELRLTIRLIYAALMGAALGKERSNSKHSAGVRTMSLVSMGAAAFTICSSYGFSGRADPSRMAANVASGVSFLGAGVITTSARNTQNVVHGLTTAATIWLSAAVGVACGVGLLRIATTSAITTLFILRLGRCKQKDQDRLEFETESHGTRISRQHAEEDSSDAHADIHMTSDWDEHPAEEYYDSPLKKHEQQKDIPPEPRLSAKPFQSSSRTRSVHSEKTDTSDLMEDVVRSSWMNSTEDYRIPMDLVERSRRSGSKSDYRP